MQGRFIDIKPRQILVVLDGMEDSAYKELGNRTPFAAAAPIYLERCERSYNLYLPPGRQPDSLVCILTMLGVPATEIPTGRAFIEAAAHKIHVPESGLVLRVNRVGVADGILCDSGKSGPLIQVEPYHLQQISDYRHLMVVPEGRPNYESLVTYAPHQHLGRPIGQLLSTGNELGQQLAQMTMNILNMTGDTTYLPWSPAVPTTLPSFLELSGLPGVVICQADIVRGIARLMGLDCPTVMGATGDVDTSLTAKCKQALACIKDYPFILVHVNGLDEASHRRQPRQKAAMLARIDRELIGPLQEGLPAGWELIVTSDHATLCSTGEHSPMPVSVFRLVK